MEAPVEYFRGGEGPQNVLGYNRVARKEIVRFPGYLFSIVENETVGHRLPFFVRYLDTPSAESELKKLYDVNETQEKNLVKFYEKFLEKTVLDPDRANDKEEKEKRRLRELYKVHLDFIQDPRNYNRKHSMELSEFGGMFYIPAAPVMLDRIDFACRIHQVHFKRDEPLNPLSEEFAWATKLQAEIPMDDTATDFYKPNNEYCGWQGYRFSPGVQILEGFTDLVASKCCWFQDHMVTREDVSLYTIRVDPNGKDDTPGSMLHYHLTCIYQDPDIIESKALWYSEKAACWQNGLVAYGGEVDQLMRVGWQAYFEVVLEHFDYNIKRDLRSLDYSQKWTPIPQNYPLNTSMSSDAWKLSYGYMSSYSKRVENMDFFYQGVSRGNPDSIADLLFMGNLLKMVVWPSCSSTEKCRQPTYQRYPDLYICYPRNTKFNNFDIPLLVVEIIGSKDILGHLETEYSGFVESLHTLSMVPVAYYMQINVRNVKFYRLRRSPASASIAVEYCTFHFGAGGEDGTQPDISRTLKEMNDTINMILFEAVSYVPVAIQAQADYIHNHSKDSTSALDRTGQNLNICDLCFHINDLADVRSLRQTYEANLAAATAARRPAAATAGRRPRGLPRGWPAGSAGGPGGPPHPPPGGGGGGAVGKGHPPPAAAGAPEPTFGSGDVPPPPTGGDQDVLQKSSIESTVPAQQPPRPTGGDQDVLQKSTIESTVRAQQQLPSTSYVSGATGHVAKTTPSFPSAAETVTQQHVPESKRRKLDDRRRSDRIRSRSAQQQKQQAEETELQQQAKGKSSQKSGSTKTKSRTSTAIRKHSAPTHAELTTTATTVPYVPPARAPTATTARAPTATTALAPTATTASAPTPTTTTTTVPYVPGLQRRHRTRYVGPQQFEEAKNRAWDEAEFFSEVTAKKRPNRPTTMSPYKRRLHLQHTLGTLGQQLLKNPKEEIQRRPVSSLTLPRTPKKAVQSQEGEGVKQSEIASTLPTMESVNAAHQFQRIRKQLVFQRELAEAEISDDPSKSYVYPLKRVKQEGEEEGEEEEEDKLYDLDALDILDNFYDDDDDDGKPPPATGTALAPTQAVIPQ